MVDLGIIITKPPVETNLVNRFLQIAKDTIENNKTVGLFLISDGIWLVKKNQNNNSFELLKNLIDKNVEVIVSKDHLLSSGLSEDEIVENVIISEKPYSDLVDNVMENYERVIKV
jgi:sulfur relay (sulfurtransferase) complex TusBCD TusD component (DsrE family)